MRGFVGLVLLVLVVGTIIRFAVWIALAAGIVLVTITGSPVGMFGRLPHTVCLNRWSPDMSGVLGHQRSSSGVEHEFSGTTMRSA
jgi:hypothetical protein